MKIKALILGLALLLSAISGFAQCGDNIMWNIENGILTISGEGAMCDYTGPMWDFPPWCFYEGSITAIVIENGITRIGNFAFFTLGDITSVTLPNSLTSIGGASFYACDNLTLITNFNPVPIDIYPDTFWVEASPACTLEVPINSVSAYKNADVWKEFNIVGVEVGVDELRMTNDELRVYPNPTTGKVYIETESEIKVYNQQGELLQETFGNQVDLSDYPKGVYLLQVNGRLRKVVKQ